MSADIVVPSGEVHGDPPTIDEFSIYAGLVYVNDQPEFEGGFRTLAECNRAMRDHCIALLANPLDPPLKVQGRILNRWSSVWLDPDGGKADHPDGWFNIELRMQAGRGPL